MKKSFEELKPDLESILAKASYPDWPTKGVLFRDIMPLFQHPQLVSKLCTAIANHCRTSNVSIEAVAGLEARGFLFGPIVAVELGVPFVPIRKKGKLPGETISRSYEKEYGKDTFEIQKGAIKPGTNVLIVDDLLATGGTMNCAIELIRATGGHVAEVFCLIELKDLNGRAALPKDTSVCCVLEF